MLYPFSALVNLHLYDFNILVESGYLLLDEFMINAHPNNLNMVFPFLKILCLDHIFTLFIIHTIYQYIIQLEKKIDF